MKAFTKMHGAGNDFVVIDGVTQAVNLNTNQLRRLATGIAALDVTRS